MVEQDNPSVTHQVFAVRINTVGEGLYDFWIQIQRFCLFDHILILIFSSNQEKWSIRTSTKQQKHKILAATPTHRQKCPPESSWEGILKGEQLANKPGWGIGRMAKYWPGHLSSPEQVHKPPQTPFRCSLDVHFCCPNQYESPVSSLQTDSH